jgi:hypothetical protein
VVERHLDEHLTIQPPQTPAVALAVALLLAPPAVDSWWRAGMQQALEEESGT